jgi:hypothetical protein
LLHAELVSAEISDITTAIARLESLLAVSDCTVAIEDSNNIQGKSAFLLLKDLLERALVIHDPEEVEVN